MKEIKEKRDKLKFYAIFFAAIVFFLLGLNTELYLFNIVSIVLAIYVYKNGYESLFGQTLSEERQEKIRKREQYRKMMENYKKERTR